MVTDLLSLQLAFRALSDAPDGEDEDVDTSSGDEELEDKDEVEDEEDLANAGFGIEEPGSEGAE